MRLSLRVEFAGCDMARQSKHYEVLQYSLEYQ